MRLDHDLMLAVHYHQISPGAAFEVQAKRDAGVRDVVAATASQGPDELVERMRSPGTSAEWAREQPLIAKLGSPALLELLAAHEATVETGPWSECQKNAKRRVVLNCWYASRECPDAREPDPQRES